MSQTKYSERQIVTGRRKRQMAKDTKRLRELVADLPFNKIVGLQEIWERQHRELSSPTHRVRAVVGLSKKSIGQ